ncbi:nuclear transport factor 2 family protein [Sphingomonas alpina]|uniref:Nuclear transport factor 2 family protein n=1 Tax=Sphingomonas alpina TaxID=653931 RepID=A0A7H0LP63_9SPHN|nr:nuclear transport factor 2 family protein [Sphingomonas alpina]QNQ11466.1 nuclear transport factor 2 family protein [Sphingomonas alpina]
MDVVGRWHDYIESNDPAKLDALIAEDAVFLSPAVHRPQAGKALVMHYLRAAMVVLNNDSFRYVDEWHGEGSAVLEFALSIDGIEIEGVDMIRWNEAGLITEFKVMLRPLKALNTVIPRMAAVLQGEAT